MPLLMVQISISIELHLLPQPLFGVSRLQHLKMNQRFLIDLCRRKMTHPQNCQKKKFTQDLEKKIHKDNDIKCHVQ